MKRRPRGLASRCHEIVVEEVKRRCTVGSVQMPRRITGLQRQIYSLYKRSLLMAAHKPFVRDLPTASIDRAQETRAAWFAFIVHQFRSPELGGSLRKKDVTAIEYYLRRGEKMLESYKQEGVKNVSLPEGGEHWPLGWVGKGGKEGQRLRKQQGEL